MAFHDFSYNGNHDDDDFSSSSLAFHDFSYTDDDDDDDDNNNNNNNSLMEICKPPTPRLKALNKHNVTHIKLFTSRWKMLSAI